MSLQIITNLNSNKYKKCKLENVFCFIPGKEFPNSFEILIKKICRYLFHVLAHIYWAHFKESVALDLQGHLNTLYAHFIVFIREFNLVDSKETCIMDDLSEVLCTPLPPHTHNHVTERWACCPGDRTPRTKQKRGKMKNGSKPPVYVRYMGRFPPLIFITILIWTGGHWGGGGLQHTSTDWCEYFLQEKQSVFIGV